jgi:hypothetical protein
MRGRHVRTVRARLGPAGGALHWTTDAKLVRIGVTAWSGRWHRLLHSQVRRGPVPEVVESTKKRR